MAEFSYVGRFGMKRLTHQHGQMTIEAVLLLMIMVSVFTLVHREIYKRKLLAQIVSGPWAQMQGMIENGAWVAVDSKSMHPNVFGRRASPEPM